MYIEHINPDIKVTDDLGSYNLDELKSHVGAWQTYFIDQGLEAGDKIGFLGLINDFKRITAVLAALESGLVLVNVPQLVPGLVSMYSELKLLVNCSAAFVDNLVLPFPTIAPNDLEVVSETPSVEVLADDLIESHAFAYYLMGEHPTTPFVKPQTHKSLMFSAQQAATHFYQDGDVALVHSGHSLGQFGMLTTSLLPALFKAKELVWVDVFESNDQEKATVAAVPSWFVKHHNFDILASRFSENTRVIGVAGGSYTVDVMDKLFAIEGVSTFYNMLIANLIATPFMWKAWAKEEYAALEKSDAALNVFDTMADGMQVHETEQMLNGTEVIKSVTNENLGDEVMTLSYWIAAEEPFKFQLIGQRHNIPRFMINDQHTVFYRDHEISYLLSNAYASRNFVSFKYDVEGTMEGGKNIVAYQGDTFALDKINNKIRTLTLDNTIVLFDDTMKIDDISAFVINGRIDANLLQAEYHKRQQ